MNGMKNVYAKLVLFCLWSSISVFSYTDIGSVAGYNDSYIRRLLDSITVKPFTLLITEFD